MANRASRVAQVQQGMLLFKLFMGAITGISLIVGGIGVMNVLLSAVAERTREIGVRRAVGAARRDILVQFLAEAVTISVIGSVAGIVLGLVGSYGDHGGDPRAQSGADVRRRLAEHRAVRRERDGGGRDRLRALSGAARVAIESDRRAEV